MSALTFDKNELGNLEYSLQREVLSTDRRGGYMSTTIVCCNTRRYHGLMVAPIGRGDQTCVLLSSLDETIVQHDQSFNLAIHRFRGVYEPRGHKYITDFAYTPTPTITYRVGGVILRKELLWIHKRTQLMIRYTLLDSPADIRLRLRPFFAYREKEALTHANMEANGRSYPVQGGVKNRLYEGYPWLYLQTNRPDAEFVAAPDWYYGFEYPQELARGYDGYEDLLTTGYFELPLSKGQSVIFSASVEEMASSAEIGALFDRALARRTHKIDFHSLLRHSARQFVIRRPDGRTEVMAGYPWLTAQIARTFRDNSRLVAGILYRWNRTEYYDKVKDLLGGDYWVDIDKFAERDFVGEEEKQNDLHYYYEHGHARRVEEGDKFGYDYYANIRQAKLWAMYNFNIAGLDGTIGGEVGQVTMWRDGRYMKGTYPSNSFGNSEALDYFTYQAKLNLAYRFSAAHSVEFNAVALQNAPTFQNSFISPRTRNEVTPGLKAEKIWGVDASYNLSYRGIKARLSGYYTMIHDQTDIISYYDDLQSTFVNFAISGIDKKFFGLEFGMTVPLYMGLSLNGAVSVGQYTYDSNPTFVQLADNSSKILSDVDSSIVYWKDMRVESTPQTAVNVGLSYRSDNNWFASADLNFYDNNYLSMNPLFRTDEVLRAGATNAETAEMIRTMRAQEKFDSAFVLNASLGKNWYIKRNYTLGFSLEVKNILNNQDIKTGGYEQMRLNKIKADESNTSLVTSYERFDPKYFYMFGTTYYLNVYFRF